jgi:hypothetical protein
MYCELEFKMSKITVEKPSSEKLAALGVTRWPTWSKEVSQFPCCFGCMERHITLDGYVTGTPMEVSRSVLAQAIWLLSRRACHAPGM